MTLITDRPDDDDLRGVFEAILAGEPEPPLGDVTASAIADGRRLRLRRRAAAAATLTTALVLAVVGVSTFTHSAPEPGRPAVPAEHPPTGPEPSLHPDTDTDADDDGDGDADVDERNPGGRSPADQRGGERPPPPSERNPPTVTPRRS